MPGKARCGKARDTRRGEWHTSGFESPAPTRGLAMQGIARRGMARPGKAGQGRTREQGGRMACIGGSSPRRPRTAGRGIAGQCTAGRGIARQGAARHGRRAAGSHLGSRPRRPRTAGFDAAGHGSATALRGAARRSCGAAARGKGTKGVEGIHRRSSRRRPREAGQCSAGHCWSRHRSAGRGIAWQGRSRHGTQQLNKAGS